MKRLVTKLRDRVASLQLKVEQLQIDKEALRFIFSWYLWILVYQHVCYKSLLELHWGHHCLLV